MENAVLRSQGLTKRYGSKLALDNLDLTLPEGKIIGLLGPNGSGKTTFIKLAAGLLSPTAGSVTVCGKPIGPDTWKAVAWALEELGNELADHGKDILLLLMTAILGGISTLIMLMLSVTVGAIVAKKHPILMAVVVFYGIGILRSVLNVVGLITGGEEAVYSALTMMNISSLVTIGAGYALIYWLTSKKLNLT